MLDISYTNDMPLGYDNTIVINNNNNNNTNRTHIIICMCMLFTLLDLCVSSLRRGHANLLCIVPTLTDDPRRESILCLMYLTSAAGAA